MADRDYSKYQKKVISRFYDNREQMDEQKLAELVTNLFLATGKKRANFWVTAREAMERMEVPQSRIDHIVTSDDPALLAEVVKDIQTGKIVKKPAK
ncbi:MAG: hypothetical protein JWN70_1230 [Planctomycetaceae bacterium]|nr:hypothetical protein [Planctomycetaceae bacterium]